MTPTPTLHLHLPGRVPPIPPWTLAVVSLDGGQVLEVVDTLPEHATEEQLGEAWRAACTTYDSRLYQEGASLVMRHAARGDALMYNPCAFLRKHSPDDSSSMGANP